MSATATPATAAASAAYAAATDGRGTFVLSIDFEDWHQLVHRRIGREDWRDGGPEFGGQMESLLDLLDELRVAATFFVVGVTAERHPEALAEVVARGHEVACHGYEHRRIHRGTRAAFADDVARSVDVIERLAGVTPVGYRAPWFSITRDCGWALDLLHERGFRYDSSLYDSPRLPRRVHPLPASPFVVRGDERGELVEFPVAVWRRGRALVPLGGGAYWRAVPAAALRRGLASVAERSDFPVLYFHPYEFRDEPLRVTLPPGASVPARLRETWRLVYKNVRRGLIRERLRELAAAYALVPFRDALAADDFDRALLREARPRV